MHHWRKVPLMLLLFSILTFRTASAQGIELGGGVGMGELDAVVGEIYIGYEFSPFVSWEDWSLQPLVRLSGMVWSNESDSLGAAFLSAGLVLSMPGGDLWRPYVAATVGGGVISEDDFDSKHLGGPFQFRDSLALGIRFGEELRHKLEITGSHYSNAGIYDRNQGYDSVGLSYGYVF